ncbi:hypothetical protein [Streptomyces marispadix]|uniref:Lipoprotein n=1 Tax=Streptomyces marispadix TaxID=2922868 RepID=A0ABS9T321_9ACTN|nr:hypothetical protein [Streptomyces marispadix]MCH6162929.1 hypothetical protein [Streptomyces marispadix]
MPLTPSPPGPRRRSMVAGTLGALGPFAAVGRIAAAATTAVPVGAVLTGCSADGSDADAAQATAADKRLRREATRQSLDLLARYDATADTHSSLADRIRPLREATMRHAEVLSGDDEKNHGAGRGRHGRGSDGGGRGDGGTADKHGEQRRPRVPGDEKAALASLGDAERRTAAARTAALMKAPPETARLLASLAAAGAAHAYLLGAGDVPDADGEDGEGDGT